jgi:hypothetical protein
VKQRPSTVAQHFKLAAISAALLCASAVAADARPEPRAQRLVEQALSRHPDVAHVVMHVTPPHRPDSDNVIIASSIGRIGKRADEDDLRVMHTGVAETVVARSGDRFNVSLPMLDRAGQTIGVLAVGFPYQPGNDQQALQQAAVRLRDELRSQIRSARWLFSQ